jgi:hypothetical protein
MTSTPLLEFFRRGEVARDIRLLAAQGALAPRAHEQLAILVLLTNDADPEIKRTAEATVASIPPSAISRFLGRPEVPDGLRDFFAGRGIMPTTPPEGESDDPLVDTGDHQDGIPDDAPQEVISARISAMGVVERLHAAMKGSREVRAILVRDSNRMIASAVLSSPKLTESEVESFARMPNVSEDVLRIIAGTRAWIKNYSVVVGLAKNPKTPIALSMNLLPRLRERDLSVLSIDRNVPETLRFAARKKVVANLSS